MNQIKNKLDENFIKLFNILSRNLYSVSNFWTPLQVFYDCLSFNKRMELFGCHHFTNKEYEYAEEKIKYVLEIRRRLYKIIGKDLRWLSENENKNIKLKILYLIYTKKFPMKPFSKELTHKITYNRRLSRVLKRLNDLNLIEKKEKRWIITHKGVEVSKIIFKSSS